MFSVPLSPKPINAQTEVELKIPKLTLAQIAQMGRHYTLSTKIDIALQTVLGLRAQSLLEVSFC